MTLNCAASQGFAPLLSPTSRPPRRLRATTILERLRDVTTGITSPHVDVCFLSVGEEQGHEDKMIKDGRASPTRPASPDYPDRHQQHPTGSTRAGQRPPFVHASTANYLADTHVGPSNAASSSSQAPVVPSIVVIPYTDSDVEDEPRRSFAFPPHSRDIEGEKHGAAEPAATANGYERLGRHEHYDNHHRHPPRLYMHRRVPSGLAETLSARWRSKWAQVPPPNS